MMIRVDGSTRLSSSSVVGTSESKTWTSLWVDVGLGEPAGGLDGVRLAGVERVVGGQRGHHPAVAAVRVVGPGDDVQVLTGQDGARRAGAADHHPQGDPGAERVAGQVVVVKAELVEESEGVVDQDVRRVGGRVEAARAPAVAAGVGGDHPVTQLSQRPAGTDLDHQM
jgi:hypothetical protein